jgi:hypothetical protein
MSLIEKMQSRLDDAEEQARASYVAKCAAESELFALGIQVAALKERLKLADMMRGALADIADSEDERGRPSSRDWMMKRAKDALAAFDAVPGDVSQTAKDACPREPACPTEGFHAADECTPAPKMTDDEVDLLLLQMHKDKKAGLLPEPDPRPRYASGEVPMVGDVFEYEGTEVTIRGIGAKCVYDSKGGDWNVDDDCTLVRRAAPPAPDLLARAVALLREHAYDVRVRDFLADFDKGGAL